MSEKFFTPGATGKRRTVERVSAAPLVFLHQLPRWGVPLVLVSLLITGFLVTNWIGATALLLVAAFLGWLAYLSWPSLSVRGRLLRVASIVVLIAIAAEQSGIRH